MRKSAFFTTAALVFVCCVLCPRDTWAGVTDDFDDNMRDSALWSADVPSGVPGIRFEEQNGRLELLSSSLDLDQSEVGRLCLLPLPFEQDWTATVEVVNAKDITTSPSVRLGMLVGADTLEPAGILLKADDGGRRLQDADFGDLWHSGSGTLQDNGVIWIDYDSPGRTLSLGFANGIGSGVDVYGTIDATGGPLSPGDSFWLAMYGTTAGTPVVSGEAYLDNFNICFGTGPTIPAPGAIVLATVGAGIVGWLRRRATL